MIEKKERDMEIKKERASERRRGREKTDRKDFAFKYVINNVMAKAIIK